MSSDFNKSDSNSEVVIISPPRVDHDAQGLRVTESGWSDFKNRVDQELNARPNMRLVSIPVSYTHLTLPTISRV